MADRDHLDCTKTAAERRAFGEKLKQLRESRRISVESLASSTRIQERYIHALESGTFDKLPGEVFVRGFVRNFAKALDADPEALVADFGRCWKGVAEAVKPSEVEAESLKQHVQKAPRTLRTTRERSSSGHVRGIATYLAAIAAVAAIALGARYVFEHRQTVADTRSLVAKAPSAAKPAVNKKSKATDAPAMATPDTPEGVEPTPEVAAVEPETLDAPRIIQESEAADAVNKALATAKTEAARKAAEAAKKAELAKAETTKKAVDAAKAEAAKKALAKAEAADLAKAEADKASDEHEQKKAADLAKAEAAKATEELEQAKVAELAQAKAAAAAEAEKTAALATTEAAQKAASSQEPAAASTNSAQVAASSQVATTGVQSLELTVTRAVRIKVALDTGESETKELKPDTYKLTFNDQANLLIYDASALKISYNGRDLGSLGDKGRRRRLSFQAKKPDSVAPL